MKPKRKTEFAGVGALVQLLGVVAPLGGIVLAGDAGLGLGLLVGIPLLLIGSRMSIKYVCPSCANPVASKAVKVCPACGLGGGR